ncbi:hypothetical protein WY13_03373 [Clostridium ljungdahlii]|uniref:Uncharacterized protein n=1 Tax=Clostridium ljungdahlii TaxID=1538 RepID=A0A162KT11_9CLOT|nr:hypothetical protein WY13_03373 [Clostridium ljungdahlii]
MKAMLIFLYKLRYETSIIMLVHAISKVGCLKSRGK